MLSETARYYYLKCMNIQVWKLKPRAASMLWVNSKNASLLLIAHITGKTAGLQQELWEKIADALRRQHLNVTTADENTPASKIVYFGAAPDLDKSAVTTHSLATLIEKPHLKAETWHLLKEFFSL